MIMTEILVIVMFLGVCGVLMAGFPVAFTLGGSALLFGGIAAWALVQMQLVNRAAHSYVPDEGGSVQGDIRLGIIALVLYGIIAGIHTFLGYSPFGG